MVVQHNINAMTAYNKLNVNVTGLKKSSEKLASGYRINRAGDDAAGLAISEKMRSQIKGLNQAVRNSQDGINMIQTFEGAATNTHEILQRMKVLAEESANGNYQNEVDREALQLEFNSLNDELNQIADTDFNGVVMLNGGEMADGLKAVNGQFDYANFQRDPGQLDKSFVNVLDYSKLDDIDADAGTIANKMWNTWNDKWDRSDELTNNDGPDYIEFTFTYDATSGEWSHKSNSAGVEFSDDAIDQKGNGGFTFGADEDTKGAINVVIDETQLMNGDTITVRVNNPAAGITKPGNIGVSATRSSGSLVEGNDAAKAVKDQDANLKVTLTPPGADVPYTKDMQKFVEQLNGATFSASYSSNAASKATDFSLTLADGTVIDSTTGATVTLKDGTTVTIDTQISEEGKLKMSVGGDTGLVVEFEAVVQKEADTGKTGSSGTIKYTIGVEHGQYDDSQLPTAEVVDPEGTKVSKSNAFNAATAPLTYSDHLILQTGARTKDSVDFTFKYDTEGMGDLKANLNMSSRADGLNTANLTLTTQKDANYAIDQINNAINKVSMIRATFGATQNRLEYKIDNLTTTATNVQEAESAIRDTDMASEMMNYTKFSILQQAAQSMLAQANQQPQGILQLLG